MFPLSSVTKVYPQDTNAEVQEDDKNFFKAGVSSIANNIANIASALFNYENDGVTPETETTTPSDTTNN